MLIFDADTHFDAAETEVPRPNGTREGGVEGGKADKGLRGQLSNAPFF